MTSTTNDTDLFEDQLLGDYLVWAGKCGLMTVVFTVGVFANSLKATCIVVILTFALWQGLLPLGRFARHMRAERRRCRETVRALLEAGAFEGEQFAAELEDLDTSNSGAVLRMYQAVVVNRGRTSKTDAIEKFLEVEKQRLEAQVASANAAIEQVVQCGLLGSLIGITAALAAGSDVEKIAAGMSTMTSTTVAGIAASITLWGFADHANRAIEKHLAQLAQLGGMLGGEDGMSPTTSDDPDGDDGGQFLSLFAGRRHATQPMET